jgi:hypothetical protein
MGKNIIRTCQFCNSVKQKNKRLCFNILCKANIKKKLESHIKKKNNILKKKEKRTKKKNEKKKEKQEKRMKKAKEKKLRAPRAGTSVKGRDGSTRHGMTTSVSKYHAPEITEEDVDNRNNLLKIDPSTCFWCKDAPKQDNDHAHPCCNTTHHEYSYTNVLNIVPSCKSCNQKKGGTRLSEWIEKLKWPEKDKEVYKKWLCENKKKLLFDDADIEYLERSFITIDNIHRILEYCAKFKLDPSQFICVNIPEDLKWSE